MKKWKRKVFEASDPLFGLCGKCGKPEVYGDTGWCEACINGLVEEQPEMREIRGTTNGKEPTT
jgi:hypothetical protein